MAGPLGGAPVRLSRRTHRAGGPFAASLAARYSKAKHGGRVTVHVATCADVSKPRGFPPGKVELRRFSTLYASPASPSPPEGERAG